MSNVIDLWKYKRARLGLEKRPIHRRARPIRTGERHSGGLVSIGVVTDELLRRLIED